MNKQVIFDYSKVTEHYTVKKVSDLPVYCRDVTNQTIPGGDVTNQTLPGGE
jgi:hypothetical protein